MKKLITIAIFLTLLVGGYLAYDFYSNQDQALATSTDLETTVIERGTLVDAIGATGTVRSNQSANLTWQTSGTVDLIEVQVGDRVTNGQVLASLMADSLSPDVILAQADLVDAQQALDDLLNSATQQSQALKAVEDAQEALDDALNPDLAQARAFQAIANAEKNVEDAQDQLDIVTAVVPQDAIDQAYANMLLAEKRLNNTLEAIEDIEWQITKASAMRVPQEAPEETRRKMKEMRRKILKGLRQAAEGLEMQRTQDQISYENAVAKYDNLLQPPDPVEVAVAESNLAEAQAQLAEAQREWERIKDGSSPGEIALLEAQLADAQREWERVKAGPAPDDIAAAEARVAAAEAALAQTSIEAPFDGIVTLVESQPHDQVDAGALALRIDDLSHLLVDLDVSEVDINQIEVGQSVELTFDAIFSRTYHGEVIEVALVGTEEGGITNFGVTVELIDADEYIKPGMTSAVNITTTQLDDVLLVPNRSVSVVDNQMVVYVLENYSNVVVIPVMIGATSDIYSQVVDGNLQDGDRVVLNPTNVLVR
jgi:HlyD family secretion protein